MKILPFQVFILSGVQATYTATVCPIFSKGFHITALITKGGNIHHSLTDKYGNFLSYCQRPCAVRLCNVINVVDYWNLKLTDSYEAHAPQKYSFFDC